MSEESEPHGIVIVDRSGLVWQRHSYAWHCALPNAGLGAFRTFEELDASRGPLTSLVVEHA